MKVKRLLSNYMGIFNQNNCIQLISGTWKNLVNKK